MEGRGLWVRRGKETSLTPPGAFRCISASGHRQEIHNLALLVHPHLTSPFTQPPPLFSSSPVSIIFFLSLTMPPTYRRLFSTSPCPFHFTHHLPHLVSSYLPSLINILSFTQIVTVPPFPSAIKFSPPHPLPSRKPLILIHIQSLIAVSFANSVCISISFYLSLSLLLRSRPKSRMVRTKPRLRNV